MDSIPFDWPGAEPASGSSRGEYERSELEGGTSGASRPSSRGSAAEGEDFAASGAKEGFCSDDGAIPDELGDPDPVFAISGSLLHGADRLLIGGGRRSGGKTTGDGRRTALRPGPASETAAVILDASIAEVRIDRRRAAAMSRSRGDCWRVISSSEGMPTTGDAPNNERGLVSAATDTGPLLRLHSESVYWINNTPNINHKLMVVNKYFHLIQNVRSFLSITVLFN